MNSFDGGFIHVYRQSSALVYLIIQQIHPSRPVGLHVGLQEEKRIRTQWISIIGTRSMRRAGHCKESRVQLYSLGQRTVFE